MKYIVIILFIFLPLISFSQISTNEFDPIKWKTPYTLDAPKGWGVERFLIPIGFAPTIPYKGVEDIRFSPGWAKKETDEYWSYAFLWYLEGTPKFDFKILESNLIAYYSGLFNINTDKSKFETTKLIQVTAFIEERAADKGDSKTFQGKVNMNDYLTKEPITINLRIHIKYYEGQKKTIAFYEVSPKPYTNNVWASLDQLWVNLKNAQSSYGQSIAAGNKPINGGAESILWTADWSADDKKIAVGGDDKILQIYDSKNLKLLKAYQLKSMIRQVSWHPANNILAIATNDDKVSILNTETEQFIQLKGITNGARGIDWNFNGQLLATADNDGLVKIWDSTGYLLRTIKKEDNNSYFSISWHPSKNIIAVSGDDIRLMDTSGVTLKVIKHRKENTGILTISWHPSGDFFATGDYGQDKEGVKSIIQFWKPDGTLTKTLYGSKAEYRNIRWNKSGTLLASASDALRIWNANGKLLWTGKSKDLLWGLDWNSKSEKIITSSITGKIKIWNANAQLISDLSEYKQ